MPQANPAALEFLLTRRSRPARTLSLPVPGEADLRQILTVAARSPDHGKLEPWRFVVLDRTALLAMAERVSAKGAALNLDPDKQAKSRDEYANAHLAVVVVVSPVESKKIPRTEQLYSAGAVCLAMVNGALASGWGANWLSGWPSRDPEITGWLGLTADEEIAGIIHLGTESAAPPERPRPDIDAITTWFAP